MITKEGHTAVKSEEWYGPVSIFPFIMFLRKLLGSTGIFNQRSQLNSGRIPVCAFIDASVGSRMISFPFCSCLVPCLNGFCQYFSVSDPVGYRDLVDEEKRSGDGQTPVKWFQRKRSAGKNVTGTGTGVDPLYGNTVLTEPGKSCCPVQHILWTC